MDETLLRLQLLLSDQIADIQKNKGSFPEYKPALAAYQQTLNVISVLLHNPDAKFVPYNGKFWTDEQLDKMFHRKDF